MYLFLTYANLNNYIECLIYRYLFTRKCIGVHHTFFIDGYN